MEHAMWMEKRWEIYEWICSENLKETRHLENLSVGGG